MTLSSRHRIRNSSPGGLRPSTLPLGHGGSPQYWLSHVDGEETFLFLSNRQDREPNPELWRERPQFDKDVKPFRVRVLNPVSGAHCTLYTIKHIPICSWWVVLTCKHSNPLSAKNDYCRFNPFCQRAKSQNWERMGCLDIKICELKPHT